MPSAAARWIHSKSNVGAFAVFVRSSTSRSWATRTIGRDMATGVDHCAGEPRGHHPFAKCPTELWSWVTLYVANVVALLAAFLVVAILWFLRMLCKGRSRDIYSLSRYDVFSKVGGAVLSAFGLPFLMPILVLGAPLLVLFVSIRRWLLHRGVRIPSYVLSRDRHQFHRVSNNLDAGDVEMAATVNLPWSRRGWLVMLRDREREPVGLSDKEARLRTFMTRLRKNSERPSVVLGCEDDSFFLPSGFRRCRGDYEGSSWRL